MDEKCPPIMLVTANVGSIFEDPENLLKTWIKEFLTTVKRLQPKFLALHCQEVGGKNYEESMRHVEDFVRTLMASEELMNFAQVRVFLDEDFTCTEKFTALGSLYFIHNSLQNAQIWDWHDQMFVQLVGKEVHSGNIEKVTTKEKAKFPQDFFPECKWSRKGFLRTRWNVNGTVFDLVNIHLFHDASNFVAIESFPSAYTKNRQHALEYVIKRFQTDKYEKVPYFMFGDFNFRLDTWSVIQKLTNRAIPIHVKNPKTSEMVKMLYRDTVNENRVVLTLEKKVFDVENQEEAFLQNNGKWLKEYDKELQTFRDQVYEFEIQFPPSYPFREDSSGATHYMKTRCPSWCDRVLLSKQAKDLIYMTPQDTENRHVLYQLLGSNVPMGDHKPVMLWFRLHPQSGMHSESLSSSDGVKCCRSSIPTMPPCPPISKSLSSPSLRTERSFSVTGVDATDGCTETNQIIKSLRNTPESLAGRVSLSRRSSRLHSHHSSSSEEWYMDSRDRTDSRLSAVSSRVTMLCGGDPLPRCGDGNVASVEHECRTSGSGCTAGKTDARRRDVNSMPSNGGGAAEVARATTAICRSTVANPPDNVQRRAPCPCACTVL